MVKKLVGIREANPVGGDRPEWVDVEPGSIGNAQAEYDAGYVDLVTSRDKDNFYLHSIARAKRDKDRRPYFARKFEDEAQSGKKPRYAKWLP